MTAWLWPPEALPVDSRRQVRFARRSWWMQIEAVVSGPELGCQAAAELKASRSVFCSFSAHAEKVESLKVNRGRQEFEPATSAPKVMRELCL